jgi:hypothetical protein
MAKKKAKKADTDKLPKKIAGVKVPKEVRKAGDQLAKLVQEPLAREIALAALAAGLAARKDVHKTAKQAALQAGDAAGDVAQSSGWVSAALGAAALEAGRRVLVALEEGQLKGPAGGGKLARTIKTAATVAGGLRH